MRARLTAGSISLWTTCAAAVVALTVLALTPSIRLFPQAATDDVRIALVASIVAGPLYRSWTRPAERRTILTWAATGAAVTLATFLVLRMLPVEAKLRIPTPNILARLLGADGELADDTFLYEVANEIWLCLAAVAITIRFAAAKLGKGGLPRSG